MPIAKVTVRSGKAATWFDAGRASIDDQLIFYMVGGAVQELLGLPNGGGTAYTEGGDYYQARVLAGSDWSRIDAADVEARRFVRDHLPEIQRLAGELERRGELSGAEVNRFLDPPPAASYSGLTIRAAPSGPKSMAVWDCASTPKRQIGRVEERSDGWASLTVDGHLVGIFASISAAANSVGRPARRRPRPVSTDDDPDEARGFVPAVFGGR